MYKVWYLQPLTSVDLRPVLFLRMHRTFLKHRSSQIVCTFHVLNRVRTTIHDGRRHGRSTYYYETRARIRVCDDLDLACVGDAPSNLIASVLVDDGRGSHGESATAYGHGHEIGECPSACHERDDQGFSTDDACRDDVRRVVTSACDLCPVARYYAAAMRACRHAFRPYDPADY